MAPVPFVVQASIGLQEFDMQSDAVIGSLAVIKRCCERGPMLS
jgi:hypothetical protein